MECQRCQGLIVQDQVWDPDEALQSLSIWRCLNCGETVDWRILKNRYQLEHLKMSVDGKVA